MTIDPANGSGPGADGPESETLRLNRILKIIGRSNRALIYVQNETDLLHGICRIVTEEGGYCLAGVGYAENRDVRTLRLVARAGTEADNIDEAWVGAASIHERSPARAALRSGSSVCLEEDFVAERSRRVIRSCLALPLKDEHDDPFGVLAVYSTEPNAFTSDEIRLLEELAGDLAFGIVAIRTRDAYRLAEAQSRAHLQFLQGLDRVNRAIQEARDPEQMMRNVLDAVISLFGCDCAYLMYPCDPDAASWTVPMERARPGFPGTLELGLEQPMNAEVARTLRLLLGTDGPLCFGPGNPYALPRWRLPDPYGIRSFMGMAIHPKTGRPWQFGIHQCSDRRTWTSAEATLFQEIGRRLADGLTSLLTQRDLRDSETRLRTLVQTIPDLVWLKDPDGAYLRCNPKVERLLDAAEADIVGRTDYDFFERELADAFRAQDLEAMQTGAPSVNEEWLTFADNGYRGLFETVKTPVRDPAGKLIGVLGISRDISARKATERKIEHLAYHDALTGLPNRRLLLDRLQQALAGSARTGNHGALLFVDLDNFKLVNDTCGHETGDRLLLEVAGRLVACVREGDTIARLGGDEFVVMLIDLKESATEAAAQAISVGEKIQAELNRPYAMAGRVHHSSPSIGIALFCGQAESVDELLKQADIAMYQAKAAGRNTVRFFDPQMQATLATRALLEESLRLGIQAGQFVLHYQPQIDAGRGVIGAEALLRWVRPERGVVLPGEFIPLAEETGLIVAIGRWVLEASCARLSAWAGDPRTRDLYLAVNVSARQFRQADFVEQVRGALHGSGAPATRLKLELTESLMLHDVADTIGKMQALREIGIGFSMDDFGTGHSSLAYLARLPLDELKIDQSFVNQLPQAAGDAAVVQTIITLARSLGLAVIAEGVETEAQREFLERHGCPTWQGFLFGRPMELGEFERLLTPLRVGPR
ncbi:MAG: EAL domain-containing protein [Nevskia sp.]|nr:EAL domain-containing protein [Nevskia sp.]